MALRVGTSGNKTWDFSYRIRGGRPKRISLGRFPEVSLESARHRASEISAAAHSGRDVIGEAARTKKIEQQKLSVNELIELYDRRRLVGRLRTAHEIKHRLVRALSPLANVHAHLVEKKDLRELFDAMADAGSIREAEARRQCVSTMFKWAFSQDIVPSNPTLGLTAYQSNSTRDRVLSAREIGILWEWLSVESNFNPTYTEVLKVQLALGARCGEVAGMQAEEIDAENWVWSLPAARSKNKKPRRTPLVGLARDILSRRLEAVGNGPLFHGAKPLRAISVASLLYKYRHEFPIDHFTTHDLRRTAATMMVELGVPLEIVGATIGHEAGGTNNRTLLRHYVRSDRLEQKREALTVWDEHLSAIVRGAEIVKFRPPAAAALDS